MRRSTRPPAQSLKSSALRDEWASFLGRFPLDTFFTCTYSDDYAKEHKLYALTSALNDFQRWVKGMGYDGQYFVAAESTCNRDVPHLHGLMESKGLPLTNLWSSWYNSRGRASFEPPRADAAKYYCTKYTLKESESDTIRMNLQNARAATRASARRFTGEVV